MLVVFFQAEDGIRDLVRSRGLGDVYKRQGIGDDLMERIVHHRLFRALMILGQRGEDALALEPVSYTHLTLPTSDLV